MQLARYHLGLLLCQVDDPAADTELLAQGFQWRLSRAVLSQQKTATPLERLSACSGVPLVGVHEDVLPPDMLAALSNAFCEQSGFWDAHSYDDPQMVYFSYLFRLSEPPVSLVEQVVAQLRAALQKQFPCLQEATGAEWWVHKRSHNDAHQMHFDTDENFLHHEGGVRHPMLSSVLFLTSCGGPLCVVNQTLSGGLGDEGWLVEPCRNSVASFRGDLLHGVMPGGIDGVRPAERGVRVTLIVGWWGGDGPMKHIRMAQGHRGACMEQTTQAGTPEGQPGWMRLLQPVTTQTALHAGRAARYSVPRRVAPIWTRITDTKSSGSVRGLGDDTAQRRSMVPPEVRKGYLGDVICQ